MQTFGSNAARGSGGSAVGTGAAQPWLRPALPIAISVLLVSMVSQFRVPLLPAIGDELVMSPGEIGLMSTLFAVGRLAVDMPVGRMADRFDALRLMGIAAVVMAGASALLAAAPSARWVFAASLLLGAASATGNTTGMTTLSGAAPSARRGSAMALYSGALLGGQALGPALSGIVAGLATWRTAAGVAAGLGVAVAAVTLVWHRRQGTPVPRASSAVEHDDALALTGAQVAVLYSVSFSVFFTLGAMPQTVVPLIGALQHGLGAAAIGLAIGVGGGARMVGAAITGAISDRVSRRAALLPGLVLQAAGVGLLAFGGGAALWVVAIVLMSIGSSGAAVAATMLGDRTHGSRLGHTLGRYRFAGDVGFVVGPALAATAYQLAGAKASVLVVTLVLASCAIAAALVLPETHAPRRERS